MRKFLVSSKKYSGTVEVVYNQDVLQSLDFGTAELTAAQRSAFMSLLQVRFDAFVDAMQKAGAVVVEDEYEVTFEQYWRQVRKKVNRARSQAVWDKLSKTNKVLALTSLPLYYKYLDRTGRYEADPDRYLKDKYYETNWRAL